MIMPASCGDKVSFETQRQAARARRRARSRLGNTGPVREYFCRGCGGWHLTTEEAGEGRKEGGKMRTQRSAKELRAELRAAKVQLKQARLQCEYLTRRCSAAQNIEDVLQMVIKLQERKLASLGVEMDWREVEVSERVGNQRRTETVGARIDRVSGPTQEEMDRFNGSLLFQLH